MPDAPHPHHAAETIAAPSRAAGTRLHAGTTFAGRYRIVTHLGRGGMGEVYRADDLTLGVPVALKFLPVAVASDPVRLDQFRSEVRVARQISHNSVCRVYDIGESDSGPYLSMEFVDGEDLASLLRRIGRLPHDKAVEVARQLCFGLAAAHEQGVVHRDLKPANIMVDGRGNARIMDFGIAAFAGAAGDRAGTPGYMSPEQLRGEPVTRRSDIYALGVVLFELFTGRPANAASTPTPGTAAGTGAPTTRPSQFLPDIDPAVERIILRCLEADPADRPASAIAVAAALPGGDPLAAAIAAGETPSPELIAASGASRPLSPVAAWGRATLVAAMLAAVVIATASWSLMSRVKPDKAPAVLRDRAQDIVRALGYTEAPVDTAHGMDVRIAFIAQTNLDAKQADKAGRLARRPGAWEFWYRRSPAAFAPEPGGVIRQLDPFPSRPGEIVVRTDSGGRLEFLAALPPRWRGGAPAEVPDATIQRLFELAELDPARFTPADPVLRPFVPTDTIRSWTGSLEEFPELAIRVHVGSAEGKVTYFSAAYPWTIAGAAPRPPPATVVSAPAAPAITVGSTLNTAADGLMIVIMIAGAVLAWRNLRGGGGDRVSAMRISLAMFAISALSVALVAHRAPPIRSILFSGAGIAEPVFAAVEFWIFYVALEPYARRVYPQALVTWTRVLRGAPADPLVGRHILLGMMVGGVSIMCTAVLATAIREIATAHGVVVIYGRTSPYLGGAAAVASSAAGAVAIALIVGVASMLPLVTGQLLFKRRWAGYLFLVAVLTAIQAPMLGQDPVEGIASVVISLIPVIAIGPGGLLALVVTHVTIFLGQMLPVGLDWSHWLTAPVWIPVLLLAGLLAWGARSASAGASRSA